MGIKAKYHYGKETTLIGVDCLRCEELEKKVDELEEKLTDELRAHSVTNDWNEQLEAENCDLKKKVEKLREYATHQGNCDIVYKNMNDLKCTCGYDELSMKNDAKFHRELGGKV